MSEVGESTSEKQELEAPHLHGNLDDIFDDDSGGLDDPLLEDNRGFENAFDESPPVTKKMKTAPPMTSSSNSNTTNSSSSSDNKKKNSNGNNNGSNSSNDNNSTSAGEGEGGWQDDVADIPHRRELIRQIAQLLRDRKQNPTQKWLKELPYKARKLEEQLYKTADSLQAYLDKATLKHRLKKVAHAITSQFRIAKGGVPKSSSSIGSIGGSSSNKQKRGSSIMSKRGSDLSIGSLASLGGFSGRSSLVVPGSSSSGGGASGGGGDVVDLEIQQQVNAKLQEQILENIRQQQQIMRNLMGGGGQGGGNNNNNNNTNQLGGNQQQSQADQMIAAMASNQMQMGGGANQMANQLSGQMAGQMGGMGTMGLNASALNGAAASMNGMGGGLGGMNAVGLNAAGLNAAGLNAAAAVGMNAGGLNAAGGMNVAAAAAAAAGGMNAGGGAGGGGVNPLLAQQWMQQRMSITQQSQNAQMAMMSNSLFRNSFTGQNNLSAAALMGAANMNSVIPAPPLAGAGNNSGTNPNMPPPNMNASNLRSSFTSAGVNRTASEDNGDASLSPNSFKW